MELVAECGIQRQHNVFAEALSGGDHYAHGYFRNNGTYVEGYHATNSNGTRNDNYSTRGNINPYTGKRGTKKVSH